MPERLSEGIERRTYVVRIFPDAESCSRLARALDIEARENRPEANGHLKMDDLGAHEAGKVRAALDRAGLGHRYLPSYSPDMNPIERAWSKLETRLRAVGARSNEALAAALGPALAAITAQDARGWFRLAGYPAAD